MKRLRYTVILFFLMSFSLLALAGCGVRPDSVDSPAGVENDTFPNVYPDVATDPKT